MIRKATLLAVVSAALLAPVGVATPGTAAAKTSPAHASRQGLVLTVSSITPNWAKGAADVIKVSGTLRNDTGSDLSNLLVRLRYSSQPLPDRAALETYQADQTDQTLPGQASQTSQVAIAAVAAGASAPWEFTLTPAQLTHPALPRFGVYPIAIEVQQAGWRRLAVQRTFITYAPQQPKPVRNKLAFALPLIDQPHRVIDQPRHADDATFADDKLSAALTGKGRLADLLRIAQAAPKKVTWFVDPALLDDLTAMSKPYTVAGKDTTVKKPADAAAAQWLNDLRTALADSPVVATPYADPDVAALAHHGFDTQVGRAIELGGQKATQLLRPEVSTSINWPASGLLDADALDLLAVGKPGVAHVGKVLLTSANLPQQDQQTTPTTQTGQTTQQTAFASGAVTPDATATLYSVAGPVTALVADPTLSQLFEPGGGAGSTLLSRQRFIAETAMIAAEPGQTTPRSIVVAPSRRWDPNPTLVSALLKTADDLPWLSLTPLDSVKPPKGAAARTAQTQRAGLTYTDDNRKEELGRKYLTPVKDIARNAELTSLITTDKPPSAFDAAVLRLTSSAWRNQTRAGRAATQLVRDAVDARMGMIAITGADPDRPRTLAGSDGVVPVSVKNSLPVGITVDVEVTSNNPKVLRIVPQPTHRLVIGGNGQSGTLPVKMTAASGVSGDSAVTVQLRTSDGQPYGKPVKLIIRTTGYTGIALVIVGAALAVMLAAVVTRVLRRRSQRRLERAAKSRESEAV
ncbi:DUF6049 family protein [Nonomuraea roseoviolacea subsp. roseoviolacea]|uniref:DUF6049 family protein n=1 Tax=Nonomuraea roseoviolacea TaxID=103837 RepID=UPI0031D82C4C